jgi:hypothetical protein
MCQTAFSVMPSPHIFPTLFTLRNSLPRSIVAAVSQLSNSCLTQSGTGNRANVASLANQIDNRPVRFALLKLIPSQRHGFVSPQPARIPNFFTPLTRRMPGASWRDSKWDR